MTEKFLGKITSAEFGTFKERPFLIGLHLVFKIKPYVVTDGGKYCVNISKECDWGDDSRVEVITQYVEFVGKILEDANCNYVSELVNKPVEVTIENSTFKDFRILTEVI
jgi:hypothetical protein